MSTASLDDTPLTELMKETLGDARELVQVEIALARSEVMDELASVKRAAALIGVAVVLAIVAVSLLATALVLALGGTAAAAAAMSGGFLLVAAVTGLLGGRALPSGLLSKTRDRVRSDVKQIKEKLA